MLPATWLPHWAGSLPQRLKNKHLEEFPGRVAGQALLEADKKISNLEVVYLIKSLGKQSGRP